MTEGGEPRVGAVDLIRRAAAEVFLEQGLHGATTRAVTDRAGVGRGLLNHYFRWPELRAEAWSAIFAEVAGAQFPAGIAPDDALERYLATAFDPEARAYWRLWPEATDLAGSDPVMAKRLRLANRTMIATMEDCLAAGTEAGIGQMDDPAGAALRISALYDGLAGMLLARTANLTEAKAEANLRVAVRLVTGQRH